MMRRRALLTLAVTAVAGCAPTGSRQPKTPPPHAEFLASTEDSTYWVESGPEGIRVRGSPILLASYGGRYYEIFVADDDYSFEDALLVGQRIYRRDLLTGDSTLVFVDSVVPRFAALYAKAHPDQQPLAPDEDGNAEPGTIATVEVDILDIFGPYLSYEYHEDRTLPGREPWHATRRGVLDLRSARAVRLSDLFSDGTAHRVTALARANYESARDSTLRSERSGVGISGAGLTALRRLRFDENSFTLTASSGRPLVGFALPGEGNGAAGAVLELDPIAAEPVSWWRELESGLATTDGDSDRWRRPRYQLVSRVDSSGDGADLALVDSAGHEWRVSNVSGSVRRVDWLDEPPVGSEQRRALLRAFDHASTYDSKARVASAIMRRPTRTMLTVSFPGKKSFPVGKTPQFAAHVQ